MTLNVRLRYVDFFDARNDEGGSFPSSIFRPCKDIAAREDDGDSLLLNWAGFLETFFKYAHQEFSLKIVIFEFMSLGCSHILLSLIVERKNRQ